MMPSDVQNSYLSMSKKNLLNEFYSEQVIIIDWPIFTPSTINGVSSLSTNENNNVHNNGNMNNNENMNNENNQNNNELSPQFIPNDREGQIFFEGHSVALLAIDPSNFHPIMDEPILTILRSIPNLQILIVIPEIFCQVLPSSTPQSPSLSEYELKSRYLSLEFAKQLIRRLWLKGDQLHQRIRLLPTPYNNERLVQLMKQVDIILDTFPIGNSLYPLGLGLSVGTPIISINSGILLPFSHLNHTFSKQFPDISSHLITSTSLNSFYTMIGIEKDLIANTIDEYIYKVITLINNKELLYKLRIQILEMIDKEVNNQHTIQWNQQSNQHDTRMMDIERLVKFFYLFLFYYILLLYFFK